MNDSVSQSVVHTRTQHGRRGTRTRGAHAEHTGQAREALCGISGEGWQSHSHSMQSQQNVNDSGFRNAGAARLVGAALAARLLAARVPPGGTCTAQLGHGSAVNRPYLPHISPGGHEPGHISPISRLADMSPAISPPYLAWRTWPRCRVMDVSCTHLAARAPPCWRLCVGDRLEECRWGASVGHRKVSGRGLVRKRRETSHPWMTTSVVATASGPAPRSVVESAKTHRPAGRFREGSGKAHPGWTRPQRRCVPSTRRRSSSCAPGVR